jgi:hypothetical protein
VLLSKNYVDLQAGGPIGDDDVLPGFNDKLADALGLEDEIQAGMTYEEQLAELAGVENTPAEQPREDELFHAYDRGELKAAVKAVRADADEFSLRGASMEDMAAYLATKDDDAVDAALREA